MKIAIIGYGRVGGTLGKKWADAGHVIQYGARDPRKPELVELVRSLGKDATASTVGDAILDGDVVVFAIPGKAMPETISEHAPALAGKIVVDTANDLSQPAANSLAVFQVQAPTAQYFRAFNTYGWEVFKNPVFGGVPADHFYCGPAGDSQDQVAGLISDVGLHPVYIGGPEQAGIVDGVLRLWIQLVRGQQMPRSLAFKMLIR